MLNKKEGKYDEALGYYKTALQIGKYFFGANHPSIGVYLTNLGDIHRKQGNFNKAEGIYSQVSATQGVNLDAKFDSGVANVGKVVGQKPRRGGRSAQ